MATVKSPRKYDSSRRQEQARQTRRDILQAAGQLFVEQGYTRTTIADVARAAGVSPETVYGAFGNKATLLHRVWDVTVGGDDQEILFHERPEVLAIRSEQDLARRLRMHAKFSTQTARRVVPLLLAMQGAAAADPAAAAMLAEVGRQRLAGMTFMAQELARTGRLAVSEEEARDFLWATTDGTLWHRLVKERGWPEEKYGEWLGDLWVSSLVAEEEGEKS